MGHAVARKLWPEELEAWKPPEALTVSQCADKYRVLGRGSSKPGQWETDFTPFMRDIMDSFAEDCVEEIWFVKPTQTGGTEAILNMLLYGALQDPGPAMIVEPTENMADDISQERIDAMIETCDRLQEIKSPDEDDLTKKKKVFSSMTVYLAWSNSPASLASRPIRYVFFDETNKYKRFSGEEASPLGLGKERTNTFIFTRKLVYISTPTVDTGYISKGEEACDARFRYKVPCPHCGFLQQLSFDQVQFSDFRDNLAEIERRTFYQCEDCKGLILNDHKAEAVRRGKWVDLISGLEFSDCLRQLRPKKIGFQISRLYSPWHTFGMVAREFLESKDYPEKLMNWRNSWMAEPWIEKFETKTEQEIHANAVDLEPLVVPDGTAGLTCGIDPSSDGFWFVVLAWKNDMSPHLVQYGYLVGWDAVRDLVWENHYQTRDGTHSFPIWRAGIDTGGGEKEYHELTMTEECYDWLRKFGKNKCFGTKGMSHPSTYKIKISKIDKMPKGQLIPGGILLINLDSGAFKDKIHYRLQLPEGSAGRFTLHNEIGPDFISHLLAEEKRIDRKTGEAEWVRIRRANHWLDALVNAFAMADPEFYGGIKVVRTPKPKEAPPAVPPLNPVTQKPRGGWMKGWGR